MVKIKVICELLKNDYKQKKHPNLVSFLLINY